MEPTDDTITVASSVTEELNPSLAYIYLKVSTEKEGNFLPLKVLHDSGCAVTTMRSRAFLRIPGSNVNQITQPTQPILIQSCTGEMSPAKGTANIWLTFQGENGNVVITEQKVVISDHIDYDLILGRDVTGSSLKIAETNDHIYLMQARQTRIVNLLEFLQSHKQEFANVKIHNRSVNSYDVVTQQEVLIEPFCMTNISCTMADRKSVV